MTSLSAAEEMTAQLVRMSMVGSGGALLSLMSEEEHQLQKEAPAPEERVSAATGGKAVAEKVRAKKTAQSGRIQAVTSCPHHNARMHGKDDGGRRAKQHDSQFRAGSLGGKRALHSVSCLAVFAPFVSLHTGPGARSGRRRGRRARRCHRRESGARRFRHVS